MRRTLTSWSVHKRIRKFAAFVDTLDALPLYADWGGGVAMRSDGELMGFLWDEPQSIKAETDPHLRFLALVTGRNVILNLRRYYRNARQTIAIVRCAMAPVKSPVLKNTA